jgi:hypothetical protein
MLDSAMTIASLKIAYALITIGVATRVYVIGEQGGDTTWLTGPYFIATIVFAALVVRLTLKSVDPEASRDERYFGTNLLSYWAIMPPIFFVWGMYQRDPRLALLAFSLSAGVSATFHLLILAFRLIWPPRQNVR